MPEEPFEILPVIKYRPEITEMTEEDARRALLEGEEFMVLEIQAVGLVDTEDGRESLAVDFLAACHTNALASPWMKEKIHLLSDICENVVMVLGNRVRTRLFLRIRKEKDRELCLYRLSAWLSMGDDGSVRWSIRDRIDPVFEAEDPDVGARAAEARRLAGIAMGQKTRL
jgi:hypothetical protein